MEIDLVSQHLQETDVRDQLYTRHLIPQRRMNNVDTGADGGTRAWISSAAVSVSISTHDTSDWAIMASGEQLVQV